MLAPYDIDNQEFSKSVMGYRADEVDDFLAEIKIDYEKLYTENADLTKKLSVVIDKIEEYRSSEKLLSDALLGAQKIADEIVIKAKHEAADILAQARRGASTAKADIEAEIGKEQAHLDDLRNQITSFRGRILNMYKSHIQLIMALPTKDTKMQDEMVSEAVDEVNANMGSYEEQSQKPQEDQASQNQEASEPLTEGSQKQEQPSSRPAEGSRENLSGQETKTEARRSKVKEQKSDDEDTQPFDLQLRPREEGEPAQSEGQEVHDQEAVIAADFSAFENLKFGNEYKISEDGEDEEEQGGTMARFFKKKRSKL